MWILTTTGMFSVVSYDEGHQALAAPMPPGTSQGDMLLVRCRVEDDLLAMLSAIELPSSQAVSTPKADYPWRAMVARQQWARFLSLEVERLDYSNFKSRVLETQGSERHDVYLRVWTALRSLQRTG